MSEKVTRKKNSDNTEIKSSADREPQTNEILYIKPDTVDVFDSSRIRK